MGWWGPGIYDNDIACDIKDEYINRLRIGMSNDEALKSLIENNNNILESKIDEPVFWIVLADVQWSYGRLLPCIQKKALKCIEKDLKKWTFDKEIYRKRKEILNDFKEKVILQQPAEKKINKLILNKAKWKIGDVLLYKLTNDLYKDTIWYQKYVLFGVLDISKTNIGSLPRDLYFHEQDIIGLYNWIGSDVFDIKNISNLFFISKNNFLNQNTKKFAICSFTAREIEKLKIELLGVDEKLIYEGLNLEDKFNSTLGISWINKYNFDQEIINWLIEAKKDGYLIEDI